MDDTKALAARISEWAQGLDPAPLAVWLFGSAARGELRDDSDIDVALLSADPKARLEPVARWRLQEALARVLRRDVDLVDLREASTVLQMQVVTHGIRVATTDEAAAEAFATLVWSMYVRLHESRQAIIADAVERGSVHGR